jgi:hypothetical protein
LQLPRATFSEIFARAELYEVATRVGPLQLVGACLVAAEGLRVLLRTPLRFRALSLLGLAALVLCAPWVWQAHLSRTLDPALGMWLDGYRSSLFPVFPWAAFFLIGVLLSFASKQRQHGKTRHSLTLIGTGLTISGLCYLMFQKGLLLRGLYGEYELWHTSPLYVGFRSGLSVAWLGALGLGEPLIVRLFQAWPVVRKAAGVLSKESLVAYVVHLLALYGTPFTVGLVRLKTTLSFAQATLVVLALWTLTVGVAWLWNRYVTSGLLGKSLRVLLLGEIHRIGERKRLHVVAEEQVEAIATPRDGV